mgnify:CR=1 FL=1
MFLSKFNCFVRNKTKKAEEKFFTYPWEKAFQSFNFFWGILFTFLQDFKSSFRI